MIWPLPDCYADVPTAPDPGAFGAVRKFDIHTGIDLYCDEGQPVLAIESGTVVAVIPFTGEHADSPWWHNTWALVVEGNSGAFLYGEIEPREGLGVGSTVVAGELLGTVMTVLKKDKGLPMTMLHLELYDTWEGRNDAAVWFIGEEVPKGLENPTQDLIVENERR